VSDPAVVGFVRRQSVVRLVEVSAVQPGRQREDGQTSRARRSHVRRRKFNNRN